MKAQVLKATKGKHHLFAVSLNGEDWQVVHTNNGLKSRWYTSKELEKKGWILKKRTLK